MTTNGTDESGQESGGALREKLEGTLEENKAWRQLAVTNVISEHKGVKPEDLEGVAPSELHERAAAIAAERKAQADELVVSSLKDRGMDDKQIEAILGGKAEGKPTPDPLDQIRGEQRHPSQPAPGADEGLFGEDRIKAALGVQ